MSPVALSSNLPFIQWTEGQIERVSSFKLLGLHLDGDFSWHSHVEAVTSKATKRLYFLKQLKRAGVPHTRLLHFYLAAIRPVLEYAAPVWHHSLNKSQKNQIEAIQKMAIRIIFSCACDMPYTSALFVAEPEDLDSRRDLLSYNFFKSILLSTSCLRSLLPPPRDPELLSRLRAPSKYPRISNTTKKYQSFISYALAHYQ